MDIDIDSYIQRFHLFGTKRHCKKDFFGHLLSLTEPKGSKNH